MLGKKFYLLILPFSERRLKKEKFNFFFTKKPHFLGFLGVNDNLDEVFGPSSFTEQVPGYRKLIYKGARVISKNARVISECHSGLPLRE